MSEMRALIKETCERFFADISAREKWEAQPNASLENSDWEQLVELGLPQVAFPENLGGAGGDFGDMCELALASGYAASHLPLVETMLGFWLCGLAGIQLPEAAVPILALGTHEAVSGAEGFSLSAPASIANVPAGRFATHLLVPQKSGADARALVLVPITDTAGISLGANAADEPRDFITLASKTSVGQPSILPIEYDRLVRIYALLHAHQMAGAMQRVLEMTIRYTQERSQFGRSLARFQAVQHMIAQAAAHVGASTTIARVAAEAWDTESFDFLAACAKGRVSEAVNFVADVAHQCYGAMGFTRECLLHVFTRRLWCWREEFGNEQIWYGRVGRSIRNSGGADIWATLTAL